MRKRKVFLGTFLIFIGTVSGFLLSARFGLQTLAESQNVSQQNSPGVSTSLEEGVVRVAGTSGKAVVSITSEHTQRIGGRRYSYGGSPFGDDEFFQRFFGDFFGEIPDKEYKQVGMGSGVIINTEGYILTNEHVVSGADKLTVTLPDGRSFKAEVKGVDQRADLAVIKINSADLPVAQLGDSDNLKIGQWVVAIGNPFGFALRNPEPTVTAGVISALHRSLGVQELQDKDYNDLIQTDAAINPGNSGGPLVNLQGQIIGINVAIFSTSGGYQGMGFAIPINSAKRIISRLIEGKKIVYGWIGVSVQDLTNELADYFGLPDNLGAMVINVAQDSPAEKAGIKEKDVIKKFNGVTINNTRELLSTVSKVDTGKTVSVALLRDKKPLEVKVFIGERPLDMGQRILGDKSSESKEPKVIQEKWRGLSVAELTPDMIRRFGISQGSGIIVTSVEPNSQSDLAGLIAGDVILEINKILVSNIDDYQKVIRNLKGDCLVKSARGYFLVKE